MQIKEKLSKETARDYALRMIRENIISLNLAPGSMVSENELSARLGLSRTPVREAFIELSKTQIVEILPQVGSRIMPIDYDYIEESRFLRLVLEVSIAELACTLSDSLDFTRIDEILKLQEICVQTVAPARLLELDNEFHAELFCLCNKSRAYQLMKSMTVHCDRMRSMSFSTIKDTTIVSDHQNVVRAIKAKDAALAKSIMTKHLTRYQFDKDAIREHYPEYFKN